MELMPVYGPQFKEQIVKKMMPPHNHSVAQISRDTGVAVPTLYSWKKLFRNQGFVVPAKSSRPDEHQLGTRDCGEYAAYSPQYLR